MTSAPLRSPTTGLLRAAAVVVAVAAALVVLPAAPASAHTVSGVQPTDYRSEILSVAPPQPGLRVRLLDLGRRVELVVTGPPTVVVLGYQGEPYLRISPDGVFENTRSPAIAVNRQGSTLPVPTTPLADKTPAWKKVSGGRTVRWRDRRTRFEGPTPVVVKQAGDKRHVLADWTVPLTVDRQNVSITGRITYVPGPSPWPWVLVAAVLFVATVAVDLVHSFGLAAATTRSFGGRLLAMFASGPFGVVAWVVGAFAVDALYRRREGGLVAAGVTGLVVGVYGGIGDATALARSQVAFEYPLVLDRVATMLSLGLGLGLAVAAGIALARPVVPVDQLAGGRGPSR